MIIDAHIHLWNRLHGDDTGIDREALTWGRARQGQSIYYAAPPSFHDSLSTCERALAHMDYLGIDRAVVLQEFMDGKQDDYLAQVRRECPGRFSCLALFDKGYLDDPMGCFHRAIEEMRLQGFLVKTPDPFPELALPRLMPFWSACAERGLPVVLKDGLPGEVGKLLAAVPDLKVAFSHFAGVFGKRETRRARLELVRSYANVFVDAGAATYRQAYPFPRAQEMLQETVQLIGADRIVWGSDYPRPDLVVENSYRQQLLFIQQDCGFLSDEQRRSILGENALRLYQWEA